MNGIKKKSHRKMPGENKTSAPTSHQPLPKVDKSDSTSAPSRKGALIKVVPTPAPTKAARITLPTKPPALQTMKPRSTKSPTKSPNPTFAPSSPPTNTTAPTASPTNVPVLLTLAPTHSHTNSPVTKKPVTKHPTQSPTDSPTTQAPTKPPSTLVPTKQPIILSDNAQGDVSSTLIPSSTPSASAQFRISNSVSVSGTLQPNITFQEKFAIFGVVILVILSLLILFINKRRAQGRSKTEKDAHSQQESRKPDVFAQIASSFSNFSGRSLLKSTRSSISFPTTNFPTAVTSTMIPWPNISWPPTGAHISTSVCLPSDKPCPEAPAPLDEQEAYPDDVSDFYDDTSYSNTNDYDQQTVFSVASQSIIT
jgi:hypothetical protein